MGLNLRRRCELKSWKKKASRILWNGSCEKSEGCYGPTATTTTQFGTVFCQTSSFFFLNVSVHSSTGQFTWLLLKGSQLSCLLKEIIKFPESPAASYEELLESARLQLRKTATKRVSNRRPGATTKFSPGDSVLLRANPVSSASYEEARKLFCLYRSR